MAIVLLALLVQCVVRSWQIVLSSVVVAHLRRLLHLSMPIIIGTLELYMATLIGTETVGRDTCGAVSKSMEQSLRFFFEKKNIAEVNSYLHRQWKSGRVSLQDFVIVFAKEVRLGTYSARDSLLLPPAAIVATKLMRADTRTEPRYAERVPYVVIHGKPGARLVDILVDPLDLLDLWVQT